jgi:hypothetical protein
MLSNSCEVKGCKPDLVVVSGTLCSEEVLTAIEPTERVFFAVKCGEGKLGISGDAESFI